MNIIAKLTNPPPTPASGGHYAEASSVIATQSRVPVSRKPLIILDSRLRGNDKIVGFMWLCKGLNAPACGKKSVEGSVY